MEERLGMTRPSGLNSNGLRTWGMLFALGGIMWNAERRSNVASSAQCVRRKNELN